MERRDCCQVIIDMLNEIPDSEIEIIEALKINYEDAFFKAPELNIQWIQTSETLQNYIPLPKKEWEFKILSIFSTIPIEDIKKFDFSSN